ncbi:MAG: hypothetical protein AAB524_00415 [Patescibacteria group bacterium]
METLLIIGGFPSRDILQMLAKNWALMFVKELPERLPDGLDAILVWDRGGDTWITILNLRVWTDVLIAVVVGIPRSGIGVLRAVDAGADIFLDTGVSGKEWMARICAAMQRVHAERHHWGA